VILAQSSLEILRFKSLDSTNQEALRQISAGRRGPLWIVAEEQTQGRGRSGRRWISPKGNLYASLLLNPRVTAPAATQLAFVAALAAFDAAAEQLPPDRASGLRLKWPNDVMFGGAKLAGILIESSTCPEGHLAVIIGIGINVSESPADAKRAATSLEAGPQCVEPVFQALAAAFDKWLALWDEGKAFDQIREAWLAKTLAVGDPISVNTSNTLVRGRFAGVDSNGALKLETAPGVVIIVNAGDIHSGAEG